MTSEEPEAYFKAIDGSKYPCSLDEAHLWMVEGFLASDSQFSIRKKDGQEGEWTTLGDLKVRNGDKMPFHAWYSSDEQKKEYEEALDEMRNEMEELGQRKKQVQKSLEEFEARRSHTTKEINRLISKYPDEVHAQCQTKLTLSESGSKTDAGTSSSSITSRQLTIPLNVDPFALLKKCDQSKCLLEGDVFAIFKQLRIKFEECDKKKLVQLTFDLINLQQTRMCLLCKIKLTSANNFLAHICGKTHIYAMDGVVCSDAFNFWWQAVDASSKSAKERGGDRSDRGKALSVAVPGLGSKPVPTSGTRPEQPHSTRPEPSFGTRPAPASGPRPEPSYGTRREPSFGMRPAPASGPRPEPSYGTRPEPSFGMRPAPASGLRTEPSYGTRAEPSFGMRPAPANGPRPEPSYGSRAQRRVAVPPVGILGLDVLRKSQTVNDPCTTLREQLTRMKQDFKFCDKKRLDEDGEKMGFFDKPFLCTICNRCAIDKASNLVQHIVGNGHIEAIESEKCSVSQAALDFWMTAVKRASMSFTIKN